MRVSYLPMSSGKNHKHIGYHFQIIYTGMIRFGFIKIIEYIIYGKEIKKTVYYLQTKHEQIKTEEYYDIIRERRND